VTRSDRIVASILGAIITGMLPAAIIEKILT
jgi:hypothetical protein